RDRRGVAGRTAFHHESPGNYRRGDSRSLRWPLTSATRAAASVKPGSHRRDHRQHAQARADIAWVGSLATVTAMAVPMMVSSPATSRFYAAEVSQARGGGITVNYSPNITVNGGGGSPGEWRNEMRKHADDLVRIVQEKLGRQARLRFE